ncbi:PepSY domain-containing protein [Lactobacillus helveticus]|uniref:PepSY domain-containing protein n=1 Tax=Lactobacillus helveticus TaxID=1587 RepID=A0A9Q5G7W1_LACHE|nr:PepSY domain-containing protein [Lactobacillus helveticus]ALJ22903.1 hypothetical protein AO203_02385 [Lactobacillus gallinarum]AKG65997.1 hypothetical protein TU99_00580 [Lactobacillus helveticus]MBW7985472.1 hypothetical protein [Lactobacillus helveticus]NRN88936.1 hypothetical protein [Lactobacillus helveticus]NRN93276.1 hypothetical protein [Lactobacillus helveticus]
MVGYVYEVEGFTSTHEYNVEINAKTGKIIDHESDRLDHDDKKHAIKLTGIISRGKASKIANKKTHGKSSEWTLEYSKKYKTTIWDVKSGNKEVKIKATSGKILSVTND